MTVSAPATGRERRSLYTDDLLEVVDRWGGIYAEPDSASRKHREGIRIFKNPILELTLTKAPPILPWIWSPPIMAWAIYHGRAVAHLSWPVLVILFVLGILLWTLTEYLLHRWFFHFMPRNEHVKMLFFLTHGYHHEFPHDRMRLLAPPLMFTSLGVVFSISYRLLFGPVIWAPVFAGLIAGYLAYDSIHFYSHHHHPKNPIGRFLRAYHLRHHFEDSEVRYGISSPLWDFVFGTFRGLGKNGE
jgi:sterol desaturase/sphingolipid hydroxylase (fatty acid hydroxylase superfamily)